MLQNHPPQILQSPARLGLPNPNSPSFSNPTTPKLPTPNPSLHHPPHPPQPPPPLSTTTTQPTTSSTLLTLLPPLSRAQSLLLQMSTLATKLFEVSPNRSLWLSSFRGSLPNFLPSQSQTPPPLESTPSSTKELVSLFTSLQTQLFESVAELQEILDLQDAKQRISREIKSKDNAILAFANKLKEAEHVLDVLVDDYSDYRHPKRSKGNPATPISVGTTVKLSDILSCAHRISYTTFAPPEFGAGQVPLRGALPPAPQEEQMRASQLYAFADLDVGLPKEVDNKDKAVEILIEPPPMKPSENNPLAAIQALLPPQLTIPSGWKPGMPVELPMDLPLPPPGWKPGDPIPMDALVPKKAEEMQPRPVAHMPPKAPEPQMVSYVELDINPDQDDDSSDYSSDVGSSEEDDED